MSTISASTTSTTAYKVTADTTGTLVLQTGATPTTAVTIDTSQNVGIGTSSPAAKLHVSSANVASRGQLTIEGSDTVQATWYKGATIQAQAFGDGTQFIFGTSQAIPLIFRTDSAERARIDNTGKFIVGGTGANSGDALFSVERSNSAVVGRFFATASTGYASDVLQAISNQGSNTVSTIFGAYYNGGANFAFRVRGDGTIYAQNTTVQSASDARFKENIVNAAEGLGVISALRPVRFDIKEGSGVSAKTNQLGFIAQEVKAVFPDAVDVWGESDDPENPYLSLGSTALIPVLVKAIQELKAELDAAKADIATLKGAA